MSLNLRYQVSEAEVASVLADLVALPSVNPFHESSLSPPYGEGRVADYVERYGRDLGLKVIRQSVLPGRDNILLRAEGRDAGRCLLFECHMDTVPGWLAPPDPFQPRIADGRLYGRGACDVKGTLAAMLIALRLIVESGRPPTRSLVLAATVDEEHQARGVIELVRAIQAGQLPTVDAAVVGEPTELSVITAHKGCIRWRLTTRGQSAHSSRAALGTNAIDGMVEVLVALRRDLAARLEKRNHPLVGQPSLCVCTIHGGVAVNVVPDLCVAEIDRRTIPTETLESVTSEVMDVIKQVVRSNSNVAVELGPPFVVDPSLSTPSGAPIVRQLCEAATVVVGRPAIAGVSFGTDAGKLSAGGIPSVVFGPGSIDLAHTVDEHVRLSDVARAAEILAQLALSSG
ncbi:MAG TPA: M20 family metallopeptidase [Chloroflexota bacterium]|nr:M20 family metallopeptidase [Chloroflexota bacterium]